MQELWVNMARIYMLLNGKFSVESLNAFFDYGFS